MPPNPPDPSAETGRIGRLRQQWDHPQTGFRYRKKKWMQLYLWGSLSALLLVVAALPQMVFQTGTPLDGHAAPLMPIRYIWVALILFIFGFLILVPRSLYSRILPGLILLVLLLPLILLGVEQLLIMTNAGERLAALRGERLPSSTPVAEQPQESQSNDDLGDTTMVIDPPEMPRLPWLTFLLTVLVVLTGLLALIGGIAWLTQSRQDEAGEVLPELAREAEAALEMLRQGGSLADVVMRCYMEMGRVLYETRGIARPQHTTPHEFAVQLLKTGLPAGPVNRLTYLFEQVRYGQTHQANPEQQNEAVASLEAIVQACQR